MAETVGQTPADDATEELVRLDWRDGVALVTLNDARRRNVLTAGLVGAIAEAFDRAEADEATRCVVLTGAGSAFCAGADLATLRGAADGDFDAVEQVYNGFLRVRDSPLPTIAAVNGPAVGAGFNLALACDVRLPGPRRGSTPGSRLCGYIRAAATPGCSRTSSDSSRRCSPVCSVRSGTRAAKEVGLVASVIEGDDLVESAVALGQRLATQEKSYVQRLVVTLRDSLAPIGHAQAMAAETEAQRWSATRPAFREGVRSIEEGIARRR